MNEQIIKMFVELLEKYKKDKEAEGFIPTIELLIEDLKLKI